MRIIGPTKCPTLCSKGIIATQARSIAISSVANLESLYVDPSPQSGFVNEPDETYVKAVGAAVAGAAMAAALFLLLIKYS